MVVVAARGETAEIVGGRSVAELASGGGCTVVERQYKVVENRVVGCGTLR